MTTLLGVQVGNCTIVAVPGWAAAIVGVALAAPRLAARILRRSEG